MMSSAANKPEPDRKRTENHDDLTRIKGIGEITQQWLRDTFSVYTFRDLASVPAVAIEERLKSEGKITARAKIEEWLAQASQLADEVGQSPRREQRVAIGQPEWKTFSTFVIMFEERQRGVGASQYQTKAHHMEADNTQIWPGLLPATLTDWMAAQLGPKAAEALASPGGAREALDVTEDEQVQFSDDLAQQIAKVQSLAGERVTPPRAGSETPAQPEASKPEAPPPSAYSGKLQQVIMKARMLAGDEQVRRG